jgi:hypothetical protein
VLARACACRNGFASAALEARLRWGKYIAAAGLLGLAFVSIGAAESAAEIEPFKTAITAKFARAWPYVLYAGALLALGLFTERAYCRFLCPLGGVLAALDRFHLRRPAAPSRRMRQPVPAVRGRLSGAGDRKLRPDRHGRMLPVSRLPGRVFRRSALSATGRGAAPRNAQRQGAGACLT